MSANLPRTPDPAYAELRDRVRAHVVEHLWLFDRLAPGPRRFAGPEAIAVGNAIPSEVSNVLFITAPVADPTRLIASAQRFFRRGVIWRVSGPSELAASVGPSALARGFRAGEPVPLLLLRPIPPAPAVPTGLSIRAVDDPRTLRDFCAAGGRGFGIPPWILRVAVRHVPATTDGSGTTFRLFVGYAGGRPVATSAQVTRDGIVGVSFVSTIPDARKRGYGCAMTWAAIESGRRDGGSATYLQATAMGRPVYEAMGFRWAEDYYDWFPRVSGLTPLRALFRMLRLAVFSRHPPSQGPE